MKQCTFCGKEYPNDATICADDGYALCNNSQPPATPAPFPISDRQQIVDAEHIKMLSIFHFVMAGLALVGLGFIFLHFLIFSTVFSNPNLFKTHGGGTPMPKEIMPILMVFYFIFGSILAAAGLLNLFSGFFLRQRKHRIFSIVVGGLNCLQIPFGTILGIFTIMVLCRNSVRDAYAEA